MRTTSAVPRAAKHKKIKKQTKGMGHARRRSYRLGKQAVIRSEQYAYRDRRNKKRDFKRLWITRINAAARQEGTTYSALMANMKKAGVTVNRKVLAELAYNDPKAFGEVVKAVTK